MLIRFFSQSYVIHFVAFLVLAFAFWTPAFIEPSTIYETVRLSPLYNLIITSVANPLILTLIAFTSLFAQSIYLNTILTKHELCDRNSSYVSVIFFTIMSVHISILKFHPILLTGFFLLKAIDSMLMLYLAEDQRRACFKIGFYIGIASLCYFQSIYFICLIAIMLMIYGLVSWRKLLIPLIGLIIPYILLATFYFCIDQLQIRFDEYLVISDFTFMNISSFNLFENLIAIIGGIFTLIVIVSMFTRISEKSMIVRKKAIVFISLLIVTICIVLFKSDSNNSLLLLALSLTALTSIYFNSKKRIFWMDFLFSLSVILIIFNNFYSTLNA